MTPSSAWTGPWAPLGDVDPGEDGSELNGERREWSTQATRLEPGSVTAWLARQSLRVLVHT